MAFLAENFEEEGSEIEAVESEEWRAEVGFLEGVRDQGAQGWGRELHRRWKDLLRRVDHSRAAAFSSLPLPFPFVVPGGRFREQYYWDTYWIIRGLLLSEMPRTARGMLLNFASVLNSVGFIPNGFRVYYLNRSQPPLLVSFFFFYFPFPFPFPFPFLPSLPHLLTPCFQTKILELYISQTGDNSLLEELVPLLDNEYRFWMTQKTVTLKDESGGLSFFSLC